MAQSLKGGLMESIAIILRRPPYGDISAAEAVRHALGALGEDIKVSLIMLDSGVFVSLKNQRAEGTGFTNLADALKDSIEMGVEVYADKHSLKDAIIEPEEMVDGIKIANGSELSEIIKEASAVMIF